MKIPKSKKARVRELISMCKKYQGEYLPNTHGPGSWATTYSREFILAASELYLIIEKIEFAMADRRPIAAIYGKQDFIMSRRTNDAG